MSCGSWTAIPSITLPSARSASHQLSWHCVRVAPHQGCSNCKFALGGPQPPKHRLANAFAIVAWRLRRDSHGTNLIGYISFGLACRRSRKLQRRSASATTTSLQRLSVCSACPHLQSQLKPISPGKQVPLLSSMDAYERSQLADAVKARPCVRNNSRFHSQNRGAENGRFPFGFQLNSNQTGSTIWRQFPSVSDFLVCFFVSATPALPLF